MKKANYVVCAIMTIIAVAVIAISAGYPKAEAYGTGAPGPGLWPICISVVMLLMAIILLIKTLTGRTKHEEGTETKLWSPDHLRVYVSMITLVLYVALLRPLGFIIPTFLMVTAFTYWFSKEKDSTFIAKKARSRFGKLVFEVFDVVDGMKQSRPMWLCAAISFVATSVVYFAFKLGLNVPMNFGLFYI